MFKAAARSLIKATSLYLITETETAATRATAAANRVVEEKKTAMLFMNLLCLCLSTRYVVYKLFSAYV